MGVCLSLSVPPSLPPFLSLPPSPPQPNSLYALACACAISARDRLPFVTLPLAPTALSLLSCPPLPPPSPGRVLPPPSHFPPPFPLTSATSPQPNLPIELDFRREADNARQARQLFAADPRVHVPRVVERLSASRVLTVAHLPLRATRRCGSPRGREAQAAVPTRPPGPPALALPSVACVALPREPDRRPRAAPAQMSFEEGVRVDDVRALEAAGLAPHAVSALVCEAFSRQIFEAGFVHCDP